MVLKLYRLVQAEYILKPSGCVLDKSAKTKKRDGGTPDKMGSPVGSAVHIQDEVCTGPFVGKVISGDDIDSLAINLDELKKVSVCSSVDSELYLIIKKEKRGQ